MSRTLFKLYSRDELLRVLAEDLLCDRGCFDTVGELQEFEFLPGSIEVLVFRNQDGLTGARIQVTLPTTGGTEQGKQP